MNFTIRSLLRWFGIAVLVIAAAMGISGRSWALAPTAGAAIDNIASGNFIDTKTTDKVRTSSNTVRALVQPQEAITLTADHGIFRAPGTSVTLPHTLTNTGNVQSVIALNLYLIANSSSSAGRAKAAQVHAAASGNAFSLQNLTVIVDSNGNGIADAGEPVIAPGGTLTLAPGASVQLLVQGDVPSSATIGQIGTMQISATTQAQSISVTNTDQVTITTGASITISKQANVQASTRGGTIIYTINIINDGNGPALPVPVTVDGAAVSLVMVRDIIPANTTYLSRVVSGVAKLLYHRLGDPVDTYVSVRPPNVDMVAFGYATIPINTPIIGSFSVTVNNNASGTVTNTAGIDYTDAGGRIAVESNVVQVSLPALMPTITYYTDNSYQTPAQVTTAGFPLFVQFDAAQCNSSSTTVDTHIVTLVSQLTGDTESFTAIETGPNTGIFRIIPDVPTANAKIVVVVKGDGIMEVLKDDQVTAAIQGCGQGKTSTTILVDPGGIVFDSASDAPVSGVQVSLIDVNGTNNGGVAGGPAKVFENDGITSASSSITVGADGKFLFPFVLPGVYQFKLTVPPGHLFPSKVPAANQPADRAIDTPGSYGGSFLVTTKGPVNIDIPLDPGVNGLLAIAKSASKTSAEIGDFVDYTVTVTNNTTSTLKNVLVNDRMPRGFDYVRGSARLGGVALADPTNVSGSTMQYVLGPMKPSTNVVLTYRLRLGPGAKAGDGINRAQATSPTDVGAVSAIASATVKVSDTGVLSDRAYLFGKVYADCNGNRIQDANEPGVPGVRIFLEDGTYAVTDEEGKYSLYGLLARTHVAKIDQTSLPIGAKLEVLNNRFAGDPDSQFVDLQNGELHKADFAIAGCFPEITAQIEKLRAAAQPVQETAAAVKALLKPDATVISDLRTQPATGTVTQQGVVPVSKLAKKDPSKLATGQDDSETVTEREMHNRTSLAKLLLTIDTIPGFIDLKNGDNLTTSQVSVRVKGPAGTQLRLTLNGTEVSGKNVGEKSELAERKVQAWDYVGVEMKPGPNMLQLDAVDPFGITRGSAAVSVIAPGNLSKITLVAPTQASADGRTPVTVKVNITDANGLPIVDRTYLTLESKLGQWDTKDLNPLEDGTQVFVEGGSAEFKLIPPAEPGTTLIRATTGLLRGEARIVFMPDLRPMIVNGLVEGVFNLRNLNPNALSPTSSADAFETELTNFSHSLNNGKDNAAARAALYLKGKVRGDYLLTLAYDSDKPSNQALFRDIQPNEFYPVYGDSSVKGFDAQSISRLYVRIDRGTSYVLFGDYNTQSEDAVRSLTQYSRALSGVRGHQDIGALHVDQFLSYTASTQVVQEFPANGTSGPFQLKSGGLVNSEQVTVLVRDRNQTSVILTQTNMVRNTDYEIESLTGRLLFKSPISSVDANLNPQSIRVTYEVDSGGPQYWVGGIDTRYDVTEKLTAGSVYVRDTNPADRQILRGVNGQYRFGEKNVLVGEWAQSEADVEGTGQARRFDWRSEEGKITWRVSAAKSDVGFNNASSSVNAGHSAYNAKAAYNFDEVNRVSADAILTEDATTGSKTEGVALKLEHSFAGNVKLEVGVRHGDDNASATTSGSSGNASGASGSGAATTGLATTVVDSHFTSMRARLTAPVPSLPAANVYGEYEHTLDDSNRQVAAVGGDYAINGGIGKAYFRHEFISSLNGPFALNSSQTQNTTVFGIDADYAKDAHVFNEYRVADGIDGRASEAAVGLRNRWHLLPGVDLSTTAENISPIAGTASDKSTALTGAIEYTANPNWKGSVRAEWRRATSSDSWLTSAGVALKLDTDWTMLSRGLLATTINANGGGWKRLAQAQLGFAYRPVNDDTWNALARYEIKRDEDSTLGVGQNLDDTSNIFSVHVNYQPTARLTLAGRYGIKLTRDTSNGVSSHYTAQLIGGRAILDIARHWDAGVAAFALVGDGQRQSQYATGAEVGYQMMENLWVSGGFNFVGFRDADLAGEDYTQRGAYMRMRFKFDEKLLKDRVGVKAAAQEDFKD